MKITENASLLPYNTFNIEAHASYLAEYNTVEELQELLLSDAVKGQKILHVGSGSNLLFLSDFDGMILHSRIQYINKIKEDDNEVIVEVGSGVVWDDFVACCVEQGWAGVENLSLIPGEVGASAVQNIGAYGVEVKDVIFQVNTLEVATAKRLEFKNEACCYKYRESVFKNQLKGQYIVTSVQFRLLRTPQFSLEYQHLGNEVRKRGEVTLANVRETIVGIRNSKLPDTRVLGNAGSFFMNPVVSRESFEKLQAEYPGMPHYYVSPDEEKLPAGWLIDQCGWKGKKLGKAGVHEHQALVLVNTGGASGAEIVSLAREIQLSVKAKFGVDLQPEVNYIE